MPARMTTAAWKRGFTNALICSAGVFAVIGVLAAAISAIFQQSTRDSIGIAFAVFWVFIFTVFIVSWIYGNAVSGSVLLDCGPHPSRTLFWVNAVLFLLIGVGGSFVMRARSFDRFGVAGQVFAITLSAYWVILAFGRLQIRKKGIWQYWSLLKWERVQSYEFNGHTLILKARTRLPFLGNGALPVPPEQQAAIDELLRTHGEEHAEHLATP